MAFSQKAIDLIRAYYRIDENSGPSPGIDNGAFLFTFREPPAYRIFQRSLGQETHFREAWKR